MSYPVVLCDIQGDYQLPPELESAFAFERANTADLSARVVDTSAKLIVIFAGAQRDGALTLCEEIKDDLEIDEVPVIAIIDRDDNEFRLKAFEIGFDDVLGCDTLIAEMVLRLNKAIFNRIANEQLQSRVTKANEMAFSAMANTADLGACLQFFSKEC